MRTVLRLPFYTSAAAAAALVLAGCGGGGGGGGSTNPNASALSLVGNVFNDDTGGPVAGATVLLPNLNNRSVTTDAGGNFRIDDISSTYSGGELQVTANGFDTETANVTVNGSALQVPAVGLTAVGTPVTMSPAAGGTVSQSVVAVPSLPQASLTVPPNALPASGGNVNVSLTPVVSAAVDDLVSQLSVKSQAVGDVSARGPEITVRIRPANISLSSPAQITLPLPFALPGGTQVPIIQKKNGQWREVSVGVVDAGGRFAVGPISEFEPTGVEAWHGFQRTTENKPNVTLTEVTLASIQNNINNLGNLNYVVDKVVKSGQTSRMTARFDWGFAAPNLPTTPVDEEALVLGKASRRDRIAHRLYSGLWNVVGGPVTFAERVENIHVKRVLDGTVRDEAGSFTATHGKPSWPRPSDHNQGGVQ